MSVDPFTLVLAVVLLGAALALMSRVRPRKRWGRRRGLGQFSRRFSRKLEPNARERKARDEKQLVRDIEAHERATGETSMTLPDPNAHKRKRRG